MSLLCQVITSPDALWFVVAVSVVEPVEVIVDCPEIVSVRGVVQQFSAVISAAHPAYCSSSVLPSSAAHTTVIVPLVQV